MTPAPQGGDSVTRGGTVGPERFARVRAIFEAALERPARERAAFVDGACVGDPALRREVGAMLAADAGADPLFDRPPSTSSSSAPEEGRFPAGTVLAGRYRILGLLGKGGMGEVYRAHDLILNQTVALKFLAPTQVSEAALARFRNEVRIARQVSHPHVCRVYDLGMVEGLHFLSMEYIDGEDLASLLRRIGRLPQDKATELTRKICAGLSAAHERGVLHRDLKPANIMIDGRGQPRITDFGLAGLAQEIPLSDLRSGTPAYMSPEQKAGKDVTARSDLYALGLVLHEMFTGKARKGESSTPSELVKDLDPAIERLILRCLEEDPKRRPSSAFSVAMALPGADPIAAALAAGETPSPEMVAASQEKEGFTVRTAVACFVAALVCLVTGTFLFAKSSLLSRSPLDTPPDGLAFQAQDLLKKLGYTDPPLSTAYGFELAPYEEIWSVFLLTRAESGRILTSHQPPLIRFWYRQHQDRFYADALFDDAGLSSRVQYDAPANTEPGMIRLALDGKGRLLALEVRARESGSGGPPDWMSLLRAAGFDPTRFMTATPRQIPPVAADTQVAWIGTYGEGRSEEVRIEAAGWAGRPVYFSVAMVPRIGADVFDFIGRISPPSWAMWSLFLIAPGSIVGAALLGWRNTRSGRSDPKGAVVLFWITLISGLGIWALSASHVMAAWEFRLLAAGISEAGLGSVVVYLFYLAIEPYVRRHWPDSLISWQRVQSGRIRDLLVASHVLAGVVAMLAWQRFALAVVANIVSAPAVVPWHAVVSWELNSDAAPVLSLMIAIASGIRDALLLLTAVVLLRLLLRRIWIADGVASILVAIPVAPVLYGQPLVFMSGVVHIMIANAIVLWLMRRFGLLTAAVALAVSYLNHAHYVPGAWFADRVLTTLAIPIVVAAWALWVIASDKRQPSMEVVQ